MSGPRRKKGRAHAGAHEAELDNWLDNARIIRVFDSYFRALDEKHFDEPHFRQIFTPDAMDVRPNGAAIVGPANGSTWPLNSRSAPAPGTCPDTPTMRGAYSSAVEAIQRAEDVWRAHAQWAGR
ncbi:hypothetical protein OG874_22255 [Nocardia sp. NBC_00565]|uniref:hypothetical protein n=1 Tax=Nocardia sp. NBC_00565 TaxID=2975993 RepID=UPI002E80A103|nr:hypothetical protein [Nocardia sp. NBC_00565]WUC07641.1 hypothetical protein OG874_22255 [Nocardia sp. NBC_00565]